MSREVADQISVHLAALVGSAPRRPPGSEANRRATRYVASVLEAAGLPVKTHSFRARYWKAGAASLKVDGLVVPIEPPPFASSAHVRSTAVMAASSVELQSASAACVLGKVLVLTGELVTTYLPTAFPFVAVPEQQATIATLETLRPAAVLVVRPDEIAYEHAFEDPDLSFTYATIRESDAAGLHHGAEVELEIDSMISEGDGVNVSSGVTAGLRTVISAHVDSKVTTPGALDNGGSVAALLALAEVGVTALGPVELVFFNGEDHYAAPGEQAWLAAGAMDGVELMINIDGAGLRGFPTVVTSFNATPALETALNATVERLPHAAIGDPWFESDHAIFAMRGIPTVAVTSGAPFDLLKRLSHAPDDTVDCLDPERLADVVDLIRWLLTAR